MFKQIAPHLQEFHTIFCGHLRSKNPIGVMDFIQNHPVESKQLMQSKVARDLFTNMIREDPLLKRVGAKHPQEFISQLLFLLNSFHRDMAVTALVFDKEDFALETTSEKIDVVALKEGATQTKVWESGDWLKVQRARTRYIGLAQNVDIVVAKDNYPLEEQLLITEGRPNATVKHISMVKKLTNDELFEIEQMLLKTDIKDLKQTVYPMVKAQTESTKANSELLKHIQIEQNQQDYRWEIKKLVLEQIVVEKQGEFLQHQACVTNQWKTLINDKNEI